MKKNRNLRAAAAAFLTFVVILTVASGILPIHTESKPTALGLSSYAEKNDPEQSYLMVGYYAAWASYNGFTPDRIDASGLTHINYAFANIGKDGRIAMGYPDKDPANFKLLNALKKKNPDLKTLISVGGWTWSGRFSDAALTKTSRAVFADSCVTFMKKYGFDGVDIDWEYPTGGGLADNASRPADKRNFTLLLKELRKKLDNQGAKDHRHYLLTIAGGAGSSYPKCTELSKIHTYLDYATIMTYDLHGTWDKHADLLAPMYGNNDPSPQYKTSVDSSIMQWKKSGFPADKLVMGIPFYGYVYSSAKDGDHGLYSTYKDANAESYDRIEKNYLKKKGYQRYFHEQSKVPWLYNGSVFISYEDPESIGIKTAYIRKNQLGGAMVWELSQDPEQVLLDAVAAGLKADANEKENQK